MSECDNGRTGLIRLIRGQRDRCHARVEVARSEQRPNLANVNDLHRRRAFRLRAPRRASWSTRLPIQRHTTRRFFRPLLLPPQPRRRPPGRVGTGGLLISATAGPSVAQVRMTASESGCQREKTLVCLSSQLVGKRPRSIDSLAKIRPHFMRRSSARSPSVFAACSNTCRFPSIVCRNEMRIAVCLGIRCVTSTPPRGFRADERPNRFACIVAMSLPSQIAGIRIGAGFWLLFGAIM